jgi:hypothetical protein
MWRHFTHLTSTYNSPKLHYSLLGNSGPFSIKLLLTTYKVASETAHLEVINAIPQIYGNTAGYGNSAVLQGASELPKIQIEGYMDTPTVAHSSPLQSAITLDGSPVSYGDLISVALEGRAGTTEGPAVHPDYFLDPFGRQFDSPRIIAFTAQYIQGVPYRQNFTMTLQLTKWSLS